jgi:UDP-glucose 4-epimerase
MRLATFYGPNQRSALATSVFLERARNGEPLIIHGDGNQTRTFTHVEDIVNGIICILESSDRPRIVNISSEESHSVRELASLCMCLTQDVDIVHIEDRHGQILKEEIDSSILRNLGWAPEYDLSSGLKTCLMAHSPLEMNMQYHEAGVVE